jgi:hypothetical protein
LSKVRNHPSPEEAEKSKNRKSPGKTGALS